MLPALLLRSVRYAKGLYQIPNNVLDITVVVLPLAAVKPLLIQMVQELVPLLPYGGNLGADLHACQNVIECAQVDHRVYRRPQPSPQHAPVAQTTADLRIPIQTHGECNITIVNRMVQGKALVVMQFRQVQTRDNLLDSVGDI
jgi:hypothetical protein